MAKLREIKTYPAVEVTHVTPEETPDLLLDILNVKY
jgi:hypothetical protein